MTYVFDSCAFIALFHYYYQDRFPSLWASFDALVSAQRIVSVREVRKELEGHGSRLSDWVKVHRELFRPPSIEELEFVLEVFKVPHFQALVRKQEQLKGKPVADPFVIAAAWALDDGCVVTEEVHKPNAARIPNVCAHFGVPCFSLETFMDAEDWRF